MISKTKGSKLLYFVCNKPGQKAVNCYFKGKVNVQTHQAKKGQIASAVIEAPPISATVKTDKASAMVEINPQELINENGWIVKDGKGFKVARGGANDIEKAKLNTSAGKVEGHPVFVMRDGGYMVVLVENSLVPK